MVRVRNKYGYVRHRQRLPKSEGRPGKRIMNEDKTYRTVRARSGSTARDAFGRAYAKHSRTRSRADHDAAVKYLPAVDREMARHHAKETRLRQQANARRRKAAAAKRRSRKR